MIANSQALGRALLGLLLMTVLLLSASVTRAGEAEDFISAFADRAVAEVVEAEITEEERRVRVVRLLREHVDIPTVSRFVLGRHWRRADAQAKQKFIGAFEASLAHNILLLLNFYTGDESLAVDAPNRAAKSEKVAIVSSRLLRSQGETIAVDWRLKRTGDGYRIIDVATEGVSMAITLRAEYASFLQRQGDVAALAAALERQLAASGLAQAEPGTEPVQ